MATLIEKISDAIAVRGLTQEAVERLAVLPRGRISKWLSGQGEPTGRQALRMARVFGLSVEFLLDDAQGEPTAAQTPAAALAAKLAASLGLTEQQVILALYAARDAPAFVPGQPIPGVTVTGVASPSQEEAREILRKRRRK